MCKETPRHILSALVISNFNHRLHLVCFLVFVHKYVVTTHMHDNTNLWLQIWPPKDASWRFPSDNFTAKCCLFSRVREYISFWYLIYCRVIEVHTVSFLWALCRQVSLNWVLIVPLYHPYTRCIAHIYALQPEGYSAYIPRKGGIHNISANSHLVQNRLRIDVTPIIGLHPLASKSYHHPMALIRIRANSSRPKAAPKQRYS